jgi:ABC-type multidrug transport system fused ATPase/permease subunit
LVVAPFSPVLSIALLATTLVERTLYRSAGMKLGEAVAGESAGLRRSGYLAALPTEPGMAKETRLFGLGDFLLSARDQVWFPTMSRLWPAYARTARGYGRAGVLALVVFGIGQVLIVRAGLHDAISLSEMLTYLAASNQLQRGSAWSAIDSGWVKTATSNLDALTELEAMSVEAAGYRQAVLAERIEVATPNARLTKHIRFAGVTFHYPNTEREVLRGLDLEISVGTSLAIVGLNGAGKTTIAKLLAGLYMPTAGRIELDDVDLATVDPKSWRRQLAIIFQDFVQYPLTARDNVAFGAPGFVKDDERLLAAAERAGARDIIDSLPRGWDTVLSRAYTDGATLSGGQWQRLALARALYAVEAGASVLLLDEPTAQLDARAEARLFEHFFELTAGLTTVVISHRFSTVRRADRIVVLDRGRITEDGTHEELVARGRDYARLFGLQASRFTPNVEDAALEVSDG